MKTFRHGDLVFQKIDSIPNEAKETKNPTLALGEATGHHHTLEKGKFKVWDMPNNLKVFEVETPSKLTHQEHKPILIPKGKYRMWFEREYDYCLEEVKQVQD